MNTLYGDTWSEISLPKFALIRQINAKSYDMKNIIWERFINPKEATLHRIFHRPRFVDIWSHVSILYVFLHSLLTVDELKEH